MKYINLIGAGRVGKTLLHLLNPLEGYTVKAICSSRFKSDKIAVVSSIQKLPEADITFLTVPDHCMEETARKVCEYHHNITLVHCSGSLSSSVLNPTNRADIQVVSVHPPISIVNPIEAAAKFVGGVCTIEGDVQAVEELTELFQEFGSELSPIDVEKKAAYHAANAIAANYLVTLADAACQQFETTGMSRSFAKRVVEQLALSVLDNLKSKDHYKDALTGPIARNDQAVINSHLDGIKPELKQLYCEMGKQTANIAGLSEKDKAAILALLS